MNNKSKRIIVVSFSAGRTSAYMCYLLLKIYGPENIVFIFMDTSAEDPESYEFLRKVNEYLKLNLICLRGDYSAPLGKGVKYEVVDPSECKFDLTVFGEMVAKYGVPYIGGMFCTDRLKMRVIKKYCDATFGPKGYDSWLGIRIDEPKRYFSDELVKMFSPYKNDYEFFADMFGAMRSNNGDPYGEIDPFFGMYDDAINPDYIDRKDEVMAELKSSFARKTHPNLHYLFEVSDFEKADINSWWLKQPFDLLVDEWCGNCLYCPKKSDLKLVAAQRDRPELFKKWVKMLTSNKVRVDKKTGKYYRQYRGKESIEDIINKYADIPTSEIKERIRCEKRENTGSCSESCEPFVCDIDIQNIEM